MRSIAAKISSLFVGMLLSGCLPGHIAWDGGDDVLRTAWWSVDTLPGHGQLFLSNSRFPCEVVATTSAAERELQLSNLAMAVCREEARHLRIDLYWTDSGGTGSYIGVPSGSVDPAPEKSAAGFYVGINEASAPPSDELVRPYTVIDRDFYPELGAGGEVNLTGDGLHGNFEFPEADLSGQFSAMACPAPSPGGIGLFELLNGLGGDPTLLCGDR